MQRCSAADSSDNRTTVILSGTRNYGSLRWQVASGYSSAGYARLAPWRLCDNSSDTTVDTAVAPSWSSNATAISKYMAALQPCAERHCVQHPLTLLHVPKAAGSFVTNVAFGQAGLLWGLHYARHIAFPPIEIDGKPLKRPAVCAWGKLCHMRRLDGCDSWHVPPRWLPPDDPRPATRAPFRACIVREPLQRMLSEFLYRVAQDEPVAITRLWAHSKGLRQQPHHDANASYCMAIAHAFLDFLSHAVAKLGPFAYDCHLVPQSIWVARGWMRPRQVVERFPSGPWGVPLLDASTPPVERGCNVVLDFANLKDELQLLAHWAQLDGLQVAAPPPVPRKVSQRDSSSPGGVYCYPNESSVPRAKRFRAFLRIEGTFACVKARTLVVARQTGCLEPTSFRSLLLQITASRDQELVERWSQVRNALLVDDWRIFDFLASALIA